MCVFGKKTIIYGIEFQMRDQTTDIAFSHDLVQ